MISATRIARILLAIASTYLAACDILPPAREEPIAVVNLNTAEGEAVFHSISIGEEQHTAQVAFRTIGDTIFDVAVAELIGIDPQSEDIELATKCGEQELPVLTIRGFAPVSSAGDPILGFVQLRDFKVPFIEYDSRRGQVRFYDHRALNEQGLDRSEDRSAGLRHPFRAYVDGREVPAFISIAAEKTRASLSLVRTLAGRENFDVDFEEYVSYLAEDKNPPPAGSLSRLELGSYTWRDFPIRAEMDRVEGAEYIIIGRDILKNCILTLDNTNDATYINCMEPKP